ncbi:hypothetical protein KP509_18G049500 [Ceratopteris richardii]|uniref:Uncharacterized protein n=1 Tax=Ceratopteris richardii TaxID=49495 RepID=A0A8T2SRN3_CERRI|nr:hypothetical protein KP509_18G049500 [Ceratopteris richardii]
MANSLADEETVHKLAFVLLIFLGASYIVLFLTGIGSHTHNHNHSMEKMAVAGLILLPALSPCATTLPVFLAVGNSSSSLVLLAILVLLLSTLAVMITLVTLSFYGASQLKFHWIEKYDKALVGSVLCLVGFLTYFFHHHDEDHDSGFLVQTWEVQMSIILMMKGLFTRFRESLSSFCLQNATNMRILGCLAKGLLSLIGGIVCQKVASIIARQQFTLYVLYS